MAFVLLLILLMVIAVPVTAMVCMKPRRRVISFLLGLAVLCDALLLERFAEVPPIVLLLLAPAGLLVALAALLVEVPAFAIRTLRRPRSAEHE